jgi:regulator of chromosome condensation
MAKRKASTAGVQKAQAAKKIKYKAWGVVPHLNKQPTIPLDVYVFGSGENGELGLGHLKYDGKRPTDLRRP